MRRSGAPSLRGAGLLSLGLLSLGLISAGLLSAEAHAQATIRRVVDADGNVHFVKVYPKPPDAGVPADAGLEAQGPPAPPTQADPTTDETAEKPAEARPRPVVRRPTGPAPTVFGEDAPRARQKSRRERDAERKAVWQDRARTAREAVTRARAEARSAQSDWEKAAFQAQVTPGGRSFTARNAAKARLDEANARLKQAQDTLDDLPERARKAGVPPGWVR